MKIAAGLLTMVLLGACAARATAPPAIVVDRTACSQCGMLISEPAYAAAIRWADGSEQVFDDIGCLVLGAQAHRPGDAHYWFHDVVDGEWITSGQPTFLRSPDLRTPMGGGIVAYRDKSAAEKAAAGGRGRLVLEVSELLSPERNAR